MEKSFAVILNPITFVQHKARWEQLLACIEAAKARYQIFQTTDAASITSESRRALEQGFTHILPVGGDGTLSLAAHAFMDGDQNIFPHAALVPLNFGTGHDFYSGLIPKSFQDHYDWIFDHSVTTKISLGAYRSGGEGKYFINSLSIGISRKVIENRSRSRFRRGKMSYLLATLEALMNYKSESLAIDVGGESFSGSTLLLILSKGPLVGGGMRLVKDADPRSPLCAGLWVPSFPLSFVLRHFSKIYRGEVDKVPGVKNFHFQSLCCRFSGASNFVEADGELCAVDPELRIQIIPDGLTLVVPAPIVP